MESAYKKELEILANKVFFKKKELRGWLLLNVVLLVLRIEKWQLSYILQPVHEQRRKRTYRRKWKVLFRQE